MGRHGGGSSGGGSRSGGGGRSSSRRRRSRRNRGGSPEIITSSKPFYGCYNRTYADKKGVKHPTYTSDKTLGTSSGWNFYIVLVLALMTICILTPLKMFANFVEWGGKIDGNKERILVEDGSNILSEQEELEILGLFSQVYDVSGMPVSLYTEDFSWREKYNTIEARSEEIYYQAGEDEDSMVILFTSQEKNGKLDWHYDMYCGDNTIRCLSDQEFGELLRNFQKAMATDDLAYALGCAWGSVMGDIGRVSFKPLEFFVFLFIASALAMVYKAWLPEIFYRTKVHRYFKNHPEELSMTPMALHSECPSCGASNTFQTETCSYCGGNLKIDKAYK